MKRFLSLIFILGQIGLLAPFQVHAEEVMMRPMTREDIKKASIQAAQKEVFELVRRYVEGQMDRSSIGEAFGRLIQKFGDYQVSPEVLVSTWNSSVVFLARIVVSRYQADLWQSESS